LSGHEDEKMFKIRFEKAKSGISRHDTRANKRQYKDEQTHANLHTYIHTYIPTYKPTYINIKSTNSTTHPYKVLVYFNQHAHTHAVLGSKGAGRKRFWEESMDLILIVLNYYLLNPRKRCG